MLPNKHKIETLGARKIKGRGARVLASAAALSAILAACGSSSTAQTSSASSATGDVPLYVLSSEGYDSAECSAFQKATGIVCKLSDNSTGPTLAEIQATKNNPHWGVVWTDGNAPYAALDTQGMLLRNWEPTTGTVNALGQQLIPSDKSYIPTGLTVAGAIVYNSAVIKIPPTSWQSLLSPAYKGQVEMNNPSIDGPSYPILAGLFNYLGGVSAGEAFMTQLKANGFRVSPNNALDDLMAGKTEIAIAQNSGGMGRQFTNPKIKIAYLNPSAALPSTMAIDGKASPQEIKESQAFANFVYSSAGQKVMLGGDPQGDSQFFPIVQGTVALKNVPAPSSIPFEFVDPYKWGQLEPSINTWFNQNIAQ